MPLQTTNAAVVAKQCNFEKKDVIKVSVEKACDTVCIILQFSLIILFCLMKDRTLNNYPCLCCPFEYFLPKIIMTIQIFSFLKAKKTEEMLSRRNGMIKRVHI